MIEFVFSVSKKRLRHFFKVTGLAALGAIVRQNPQRAKTAQFSSGSCAHTVRAG